MGLGGFRELVMDREAWCAACRSWGRKESDMTEQLKQTELNWRPKNLKKKKNLGSNGLGSSKMKILLFDCFCSHWTTKQGYQLRVRREVLEKEVSEEREGVK